MFCPKKSPDLNCEYDDELMMEIPVMYLDSRGIKELELVEWYQRG